MTRDPEFDREGIYIERDVADQVAIEEELDANIVGPYRFPSPERRRISAWVYLVVALLSAVLIDSGWILAIALLLLAIWHFLAAWPLAIDEHEALTRAASVVDFPIGHSSASVRFVGWRSRPRWSVMLYSATEPPDRRALVLVDAVSGDVIEMPYIEAIAPA